MPNLELFASVITALIIIVVTAQVFGQAMRFMGQPAVVGEMIAGVLLGPTCFGYLFPDQAQQIFPQDIMPVLFVVSNIGIAFYMFLVGAEMDLNLFDKRTFKDATVLSASALLVPFALGGVAAIVFDEVNEKGVSPASIIIFLGTAFAITGFPVLARILQDRRIVNSRIGALSILSASLQDVICWTLLGLVTAMATTGDYTRLPWTLVGTAALVVVLLFAVRPLLKRFARKVSGPDHLTARSLSVVIILLLVSALITDRLGLHAVFGAFIMGMAMPRQGGYVQAVITKLKDVTVVLLLPCFFTFTGLNTSFLMLDDIRFAGPALAIILLAFASKYLSVMLSMKFFCRFSWREASAIGGLINSRGLMDLIVANIGLQTGLIGPGLFAIVVLIAIVTTLAALPIYNLSMGSRHAPSGSNANAKIS